MEIRFLTVAETEVDEAVAYYNRELDGLGTQFLIDLREAVERIARLPHAWHPLSERTRRCRTRRFPYGIIYQVRQDTILVVAVAHLHRKPNYWRDRVP